VEVTGRQVSLGRSVSLFPLVPAVSLERYLIRKEENFFIWVPSWSKETVAESQSADILCTGTALSREAPLQNQEYSSGRVSWMQLQYSTTTSGRVAQQKYTGLSVGSLATDEVGLEVSHGRVHWAYIPICLPQSRTSVESSTTKVLKRFRRHQKPLYPRVYRSNSHLYLRPFCQTRNCRPSQRIQMTFRGPGPYSMRFIDRADEARFLQNVTVSGRHSGSLAAEPLRLPTWNRMRLTALLMIPAVWMGALSLLAIGLVWKTQQRLGHVFASPERLLRTGGVGQSRPNAAKRVRWWPLQKSATVLSVGFARLRYALESSLQWFDEQKARVQPLSPRRWFADVSDLYESVINRLNLSIEETRRIFTLLSREEQIQLTRNGSRDQSLMQAGTRMEPVSAERREALAAAQSLVASSVSGSSLNGPARAALAQLLLPHLPMLHQFVSTPPKGQRSSTPNTGPTIVGVLFSNAMIPHIMMGAAVVAAAAGARVCLVDDWRSTLSTIYAPFLLSIGLNPFPTLAESSRIFDRLGIAVYRSPVGLAKHDIRLLLERRVDSGGHISSPVVLGDLVAPLLNAYDFERLVLAPGLHASHVSDELDAMTDAVAFFRPTRAWLLSCLLRDGADEHNPSQELHLGCLLPWGRNVVREVVYRGPNARGEDVAEVEEIPLQPHRYQLYSEGHLAEVIGADATENARLLHEALTGVNTSKTNPTPTGKDNPSIERVESLREIITLNAATIILASGLAQTIHEGIEAARQTLITPPVLGRSGMPQVPSDAAALLYRLQNISW
jgi:hypothetical protein